MRPVGRAAVALLLLGLSAAAAAPAPGPAGARVAPLKAKVSASARKTGPAAPPAAKSRPNPALPTPTGLEFFQNMTDAEMEPYFAAGTVPYLPGHEPQFGGNVTGKATWDLCMGQTYINAFTTGHHYSPGNPRGGWPGGLAHPLNNAFHRTWWGKVFYNDGSGSPVTQLWNLFFSNATVDFDAVAYNATAGVTPGAPVLTQDGRPSIMIDYGESNELIFRSVVDEARLVNPELNLYLGRIWLRNPVEGLKKKAFYSRAGQMKDAKVLAALNSTFLNFMGWGNATYGDTEPGDFYPLGYFAMQCTGPHTPKLHYTAQAYLWALLDTKMGFVPADYSLPALHQENNTHPVKAGPGFPNPSNYHNGTMPKFHIWPFKPSDVTNIGNFTAKPSKTELMVGRGADYPITARGMEKWRQAGEPGAWWTPTDEELAAADLGAKLGLPAAIAGRIASAKLAAGQHSNATLSPLDVTAWAVDAIEAAHAAVAEAASRPAPLSSKLAREITAAKFRKKLAVAAVVDGFHLVEGVIDAHHHPDAAAHVSKVKALATLIDAYKEAPKQELPLKAPPLDKEVDGEAIVQALKDAVANKTEFAGPLKVSPAVAAQQVKAALKGGDLPWEQHPKRVDPPVRS